VVLEDIISGTGFGNVSFTLQSPAVAAVTNPSYTTTGQGRRKRSLRAATISINTYVDPTSVYWNTGNANYNAVTLLHELGHVFDWEFGSNSTSVGLRRERRRLAEHRCRGPQFIGVGGMWAMRVLLWCLILSVAIAEAKDLTPCDLTLGAFEGRLISVSGRALFTMHGGYLLGDTCTGKGRVGAALVFPGDSGIPSVGFKLDPSTMERLRPFFRTTGGQAIACGVFSGQAFYRAGFRLRHFGDIAIGNGFGENGKLRTAFVLKSVAEIRACD